MVNLGVLWSIKPLWTYKICNLQKKIEIRKTKPSMNVDTIHYIYCTKDSKFPLFLGPFGPCNQKLSDDFASNMQGKVVAQFTCSEILEIFWDEYNQMYDISDDDLRLTGLNQSLLFEYGKGKPLYGIRIDNLIVYDEPKPLWVMRHLCKEYGSDNPKCDSECPYYIDGQCYEYDESDCGVSGLKPFNHPPQSWAYATPFKNDLKNYYPEI